MLHNLFFPNPVKYLPILLLAYLSTYLIGRCISGFFVQPHTNKISLEDFFTRLTIGFIALVSLFAIVWTRGDTVFLLSIFGGGFYLFSRPQYSTLILKFQPITLREIEVFALVFLLFLASFILGYYLFFVNSAGDIHDDFIFYANVSNVLAMSHVESISWFVGNNTPGMYHYAELWFNSFWSLAFGLNHLHALLLVTYPYLISLVFIGAFSLSQTYFSGKYLIGFLLSILFLFFNPVATLLVSYQLPVATHPKFFVIELFMLFAGLQYLGGRRTEVFVILLVLIPFNSVMTSGVLSALFFSTIIYVSLQNGFKVKSIINKYTIACLIVLLYFLLFYGARVWVKSGEQTPLPTIDQHLVIATLEYIVRAMFYAVVRLLPVAFILFLFSKKSIVFKNEAPKYWYIMLFVLIGAFFSAVVAGVISNFVNDGGQLSVNYNGMVVTFAVYITLLFLLSKIKTSHAFVVIVGLVALHIYTFSSDVYLTGVENSRETAFYQRLKAEFDRHKGLNFAYVRNYRVKQNMNNQAMRLRQIIPLKKISQIINTGYYAPQCLSVFDISGNLSKRYDERRNADFWKYVQNSKRSGHFKSMDRCGIDFLKVMNISYVIVESQAVVPSYMHSCKLLGEYAGNKVFVVSN